MDTVQILLITVVSLLSILLLVLGVQIFFILREVRNTIGRANKVLEDAGAISESISKPVESFSNILSSVNLGSILTTILAARRKRHTREEE